MVTCSSTKPVALSMRIRSPSALASATISPRGVEKVWLAIPSIVEVFAMPMRIRRDALGYDISPMSTTTHTAEPADSSTPAEPHKHFIRQIIDADIASGKWGPQGDRTVVKTRFPPEPNGYLHIGHAKAICLSFSLAKEYGGTCNLRFDDTNPAKEEQEYVDSISEDIRWLGFEWGGGGGGSSAEPLFASDYFPKMHAHAVSLIKKGLAYVDDQTAEQIREGRGTLKEPGTASPFRDRPVEESLDLFTRMTAGEFPDGSRVLRAKIDMASPNINLRDPVMYRILGSSCRR